MQDGGEKEIVNYTEGRQLISSGPKRCLANTLLCVKRRMHTLFYKDVNTDRPLPSLVTIIANSFESERKTIDVHDKDIIKYI